MIKRSLYFSFFALLVFISSCDTAQKILNTATGGGTNSTAPTNTEVVSGLKEALIQGATNGANVVSKTDGYFKNSVIKILFPEELKNAEQTMRQYQLGGLADNIILSFNRAAESAAQEAKPIFISAIRSMTVQDAMNILLGEENAATNYLRKTTSDALYAKFKPVIDNQLNRVGATKYWSEAVTKYNAIPLVQKKLPKDISDYVANEAMDGIFYMISKEESKIRQDPLSRGKEILRKVFGYADKS